MDELEFALETVGPTTFEKLVGAFLRLEGYKIHESAHSAADGGWDARITINNQQGIAHASTREEWRQKIRKDAKKVRELEDELGKDYDLLVCVTNQEVSGAQEIELEKEIQENYGWDLEIYHRTNLIGEIRTNSPELAEDFLDVSIKGDDDHLQKLLELRNDRIQNIRQRSGDAVELEPGPVIALHVIPNGIFSPGWNRYSGEVPGPPVFWEPQSPYHDVRGKSSYASVRGRKDDHCQAYGFIRNDGLYETAKSIAVYKNTRKLDMSPMSKNPSGFTVPMDVSQGNMGFDASVVITIRRVLNILREMGFHGSSLVSISLLDAPGLKYERTIGLSNSIGEPLGKERYVTDPNFVDIPDDELLCELEPLLDEIWRELGLRKGTENIEDGEWIGNGVSINGKKLL